MPDIKIQTLRPNLAAFKTYQTSHIRMQLRCQVWLTTGYRRASSKTGQWLDTAGSARDRQKPDGGTEEQPLARDMTVTEPGDRNDQNVQQRSLCWAGVVSV